MQRRNNFLTSGICLEQEVDGAKYMDVYDRLPKRVRRRLAQSPYNLCAACIEVEMNDDDVRRTKSVFHLIREMEEAVRNG